METPYLSEAVKRILVKVGKAIVLAGAAALGKALLDEIDIFID